MHKQNKLKAIRFKTVLLSLGGLFIFSAIVVGIFVIRTQGASATPVEIRVTSKQFSYSPETITVRKGQPVKLIVSTSDVEHSFSIKELGINVSIEPRKKKTIVFTPDKAGTFRYYCDVYCGAGHKRMGGQFIVTD